jgi:hypothetical protein
MQPASSLAIDHEFVGRLRQLPLFARGGQLITASLPFRYRQVQELRRVNELLASDAWESFTLEAQNRLTTFLSRRHAKHYQAWNEVALAYKQELQYLRPLAHRFAAASGLDALIFESDCQWIFLGLCMENHFARLDAQTPVLFQHLLPLYQAGHLPCGWDGAISEDFTGRPVDLSAGTLLVF